VPSLTVNSEGLWWCGETGCTKW